MAILSAPHHLFEGPWPFLGHERLGDPSTSTSSQLQATTHWPRLPFPRQAPHKKKLFCAEVMTSCYIKHGCPSTKKKLGNLGDTYRCSVVAIDMAKDPINQSTGTSQMIFNWMTRWHQSPLRVWLQREDKKLKLHGKEATKSFLKTESACWCKDYSDSSLHLVRKYSNAMVENELIHMWCVFRHLSLAGWMQFVLFWVLLSQFKQDTHTNYQRKRYITFHASKVPGNLYAHQPQTCHISLDCCTERSSSPCKSLHFAGASLFAWDILVLQDAMVTF